MVGKVLVPYLESRGYQIRVLSTSRQDENHFHWDPKKSEIDKDALNGVQVIIHLAGADIAEKKWSRDRKKEINQSRSGSSKFLKDKCEEQGVRPSLFISMSGTGYYGYDTGSLWVKETSRFGDDFLATVVKAWEEAADGYKVLGSRVVKLRTGMILTDQGGALLKLARPVKFGLGAALGRGDQYISWIHIQDLLSLINFVLETETVEGVFNAVSPEPVTNRDFMKTLARQFRKPFFLPNVPSFFLKLILGERTSLVIGGNRVSSEKIQEAGFNFEHPSLLTTLENLYSNP